MFKIVKRVRKELSDLIPTNKRDSAILSNKVLILSLFQIPEEKKLDLLKTIAASSPYAAAQDSRQLLPSIVQLLKVSTFF